MKYLENKFVFNYYLLNNIHNLIIILISKNIYFN